MLACWLTLLPPPPQPPGNKIAKHRASIISPPRTFFHFFAEPKPIRLRPTNPGNHMAYSGRTRIGLMRPMLEAVVEMLRVEVTGLVPAVGFAGAKEHDVPAGSPEQLNDTAPLKPPDAVIVTV